VVLCAIAYPFAPATAPLLLSTCAMNAACWTCELGRGQGYRPHAAGRAAGSTIASGNQDVPAVRRHAVHDYAGPIPLTQSRLPFAPLNRAMKVGESRTRPRRSSKTTVTPI